ncbi:hypothetical protein ACH4C2_08640 [Streptomyces sp. NPDC018057]|uniref:hypothetical protein n=1 Tax=unclassified Streptomyces TaxID=2593676 RepID=UPI0037A42349
MSKLEVLTPRRREGSARARRSALPGAHTASDEGEEPEGTVVLVVLLGEEGVHELVVEGIDGRQAAEDEDDAELNGAQGCLVD